MGGIGAAEGQYERIWDLLRRLHLRGHGEAHARAFDFNCCDEWAAMMAIRAVSRLREDFPSHLLARLEAMDEVDKEFYVENILSTNGEPPPTEDEEAKREYRAARRYHVLWAELKEAAARIDALERQLRSRGTDATGTD